MKTMQELAEIMKNKYIDAEKLKAEIKRYKNKADERLKIKGRTFGEEQKDFALQNLCGNILHFIDSLQQEQPQPKNEWSKKDERNLQRAIQQMNLLEEYIDDGSFFTAVAKESSKEMCRSVRNWLKSLPIRFSPQPHWKPSEERPDFPTTDEQIKEFLATHPKIEVPEKYKNPDWLFKKQEQPEPSNNLVDVDAVREDFITEVYRTLDADPTNDRANAIIDAFDSLPTISQKQPKLLTAKDAWRNMRLEVYAQASGNRHGSNCSDESTKMFSLCDIDEIFENIGDVELDSRSR